MILAHVKTDDGKVELHHHKGLGYFVWATDGRIASSEQFIPTRAAAERTFLWFVGYPSWKRASDRAFKEAKVAWLEEHTSLSGVGAVDDSP